ncbi:MAG: DUF86 domain-containing protein [Pseudomonadota bacterium]
MPRDYRLYLEDMSASLRRLQTLTAGMSYDEFAADPTKQEAVIHNLEIIGEASRNVPQAVRLTYPDVDWAGIASLRNILIHEYFGIDLEIIWDIIQNELPILDAQIKKIFSDLR